MSDRMNAGAKAGIDDDLHERVRRLIDTRLVEGLAPSDQRWLEEHLGACEACAGRAAATDATLRALRAAPVSVPHGLAASAQLVVRRRADELHAQHTRNVALAAGCALSWLMGVASAPLVWRAFAWFGSTFDLPRAVWMVGFAFWWFVPPTAAVGVVLWYRSQAERGTP
jgi:anti-sigma factor RsiW